MTAQSYIEDDFQRDTAYIEDRITRDGSGQGGWLVEAGRYRLVAARACPWANRAIIVRRLLGLEDAISLGLTGPTHDARSWTFDLDPDGRDPVLGIERLQEAYFARFPDYAKGITVPAMVEESTGKVVTNDFPQITVDMSLEWTEQHRDGAPELYPEAWRDEIDEVSSWIYKDVNNGVYRCGFAGKQASYERAYDQLFGALDRLEERLSTRRYLVGDHVTEADVRLFTTLARFDAVYHGHFKCNRNKLVEMPALWGYARDLFQTPGFGDTTDFAQIKKHYYVVHSDVNPTQIVPKGPDLSGWLTPHGREELGGSPFGDGTPPPPVRPDEAVPAEGHRRSRPMTLTDAGRRLKRWIEADPKNLALLTLPLTLADLVHQFRWLRAHDMSVFSVRGGFAYIRANPTRSALTVIVTALPDIVGAVLRRRRR